MSTAGMRLQVRELAFLSLCVCVPSLLCGCVCVCVLMFLLPSSGLCTTLCNHGEEDFEFLHRTC